MSICACREFLGIRDDVARDSLLGPLANVFNAGDRLWVRTGHPPYDTLSFERGLSRRVAGSSTSYLQTDSYSLCP